MDNEALESQLQQELRSMFDVDTQEYLHNYLNLSQQLNQTSWKADIQEMYRSIHTIKGGAVTVGADAILYVAIALEDILSDLRYLNPPPPLDDGQLGQILLEAGELLASAIPIQATDEEAKKAVTPTLARLQIFKEQIHQNYLPDWDESTLLHQEFAEQGFDLVVLDLEMTLEKETGATIGNETQQIAHSTFAQLKEIGKNLKMSSGWNHLLSLGEELIKNTNTELWRKELPLYLGQLKTCAKQGGKKVLAHSPAKGSQQPQSRNTSGVLSDEKKTTPELLPLNTLDLESLVPEAITFEPEPPALDSIPLSTLDLEYLVPENITFEPEPPALDSIPLSTLDLESLVPENITFEPETPSGNLALNSQDFTWDELDTKLSTKVIATIPKAQGAKESTISIPVTLTRLEQTTQNLVEVLLAARASQGVYKHLQSQLVKLLSLAKDSMNQVTYLRQLQDEYAVINSLNSISESVNLENYRSGYTTINRLLEGSLRLSEIGEEAAKTAQITANNLDNLDRHLLRLQQTLEVTRLVPFKNLAFRARAIIRDLINRYGKPAQLIVQGEDLELDAGIASQLEPALLHLLRNAYDHGLELPDARSARHKPPTGTIKITLQRQGNRYLLTVQDDGGGIDGNIISGIATAKGLPLTTVTTPNELLAVICQPGFSSQETVTEISGRGVGMDVVANQLASLGGKLTLDTVLGVGTTFRMQLPVSRLLVSCLLVQAGERTFAIPTEDIITSTLFANLKTTKTNLKHSFYSWEITNGTFTEPGLDLFDYWQNNLSLRNLPDNAVAVYVGSTEEDARAWLIADELLTKTDVLINPIPHPLIPPVGLIGLSLQFDGTLIPVLDGVNIALTLRQEKEIAGKSAVATADKMASFFDQEDDSKQVILVVDDAALMRRRIEASLVAYGYEVQTCVDGLDAWKWLENNPNPILIITDIEMPNMDGFSLISNCRQKKIKIPILVVSSRLSQEWSVEAKRLGATDYLTKGFSTNELVEKVKSLIQP